MQDVAFFEGSNIPAVALLSTGFQRQAAFEADRIGLPVPRVFVRHPISNVPAAEVASKADTAMDEIVEALLFDTTVSSATLDHVEQAPPGTDSKCST